MTVAANRAGLNTVANKYNSLRAPHRNRIAFALAIVIERSGHLESVTDKFPVMSPARRSVLLAIICGMMAASFLHERGIVDLSYGFSRGGLVEGSLMALTGGVGGYAILAAFRKLRDLANHAKKR